MEKQKISAEREDGTYITLVGGNNARRIGGNSYVIEARNEGKTSRVMVDLGAVITGFETGYESAFPDVSRFLTVLILKRRILSKPRSRLTRWPLRICMKTMSVP